MSWRKTWSVSRRVVAGLSAALLTVAAVLYAPIGLGTQSPAEMAVRTHLLWGVLVMATAATWLLAFKPDSRAPRFVASAAGGFNGIWIFSFVGLPVVVASLIAIVASAVGVPRRVAVMVAAVALVGLGLGLLVLRITEPPGEHIFG
jgi:hypothetical protein